MVQSMNVETIICDQGTVVH
ncbi:hypothetical protein [Bacillus cereus]